MELSKKRKTDENGGGGVAFLTATNDVVAPPSSDLLTPQEAEKIIEPFSIDQLRSILRTAILLHPDVLDAVRSVADSDPTNRKLFVRGLGWETTTEKLRSIFSGFGELDEAIVITDKNTGKSKGYGFVTFKHADAAILALREPNKKIDGRITVTHLAAAGNSGGSGGVDVSMRKIYVGNVPFEISSERLLTHFSAYGEIEEGPLGFDKQTGKAKGFAFFVYKTEEGARASLVDPMKNIDGHQVVCKLAVDGKKGKPPGPGVPVSGGVGVPGPPAFAGDVSGGDRLGVPPSNYGLTGGGLPSYGGFSGGPMPGIAHQNPVPPPIGGQGNAFGNQGPVSFGSGAGGYGVGYGSGDYTGLSNYRMSSSSLGMPSSGVPPDGGNYGLSSAAVPSQLHQPSPGQRVPPGGMYQPPYY